MKWSFRLIGAALFAAAALVACGGGGDSNGYGAVAVSGSKSNVAISSEHITQSVANDAARDECDVDDCKVILQFEECGAAAGGYTNSGVLVITAGAGNTAYDAQTVANANCSAAGGNNCGPFPNLGAQCN